MSESNRLTRLTERKKELENELDEYYEVLKSVIDIIRLENDLKALLAEIDTALQAHFRANTQTQSAKANGHAEVRLIPFAVIDAVDENSPASKAGLVVNDEVLKFGICHAGNHNGLRKVAEFVATMDGREIEVTVKRDGEEKKLHLTPDSRWGGRGSLGCHLTPK
ncbi:hypothetical protein TRICI_001442 [Trichomonascus ciferrii]|uniref:Probable 26S proteasome regulatory subunit p27 n=1 Tax=Trichomonascus ciferrii TaxID=44093 RepID=A0A642V995_9ASCO|nr:hypothetical protein TRICI_001442 [Trichomonascus ciferrii]